MFHCCLLSSSTMPLQLKATMPFIRSTAVECIPAALLPSRRIVAMVIRGFLYTLQARGIACVVIIGAVRLLNLAVPILYKKVKMTFPLAVCGSSHPTFEGAAALLGMFSLHLTILQNRLESIPIVI